MLPNKLTANHPPFYKDEQGRWWYVVRNVLFGPYQEYEEATHFFQLERIVSR